MIRKGPEECYITFGPLKIDMRSKEMFCKCKKICNEMA